MKRNNRVGLSRLSIIPRGRRLVGTRTPSWRRAKNSGLIKGEVHFSKGIALQNALRIFLVLHLINVFFFSSKRRIRYLDNIERRGWNKRGWNFSLKDQNSRTMANIDRNENILIDERFYFSKPLNFKAF